MLLDYIKDSRQRAALEVLAVDQDAGRPELFPPGVPDHLVQAMRTAFDETMKDTKFLAEAGNMNLQLEPMSGEQIEAEIKGAYTAPEDVVTLAAKLWPPALPKNTGK
jgi:tripartite-type tricarboxylate transporter receptor subunit TctC